MKISVFGNPDYEPDSLPLKILPALKEKFPEIDFRVEDPNELDLPDAGDWLIVDTVVGLKKVTLLGPDDIKQGSKTGVSMHGFDLSSHLSWIKKIAGKTEIKIIGVPPIISEKETLKETIGIIASLLPKNGRRS